MSRSQQLSSAAIKAAFPAPPALRWTGWLEPRLHVVIMDSKLWWLTANISAFPSRASSAAQTMPHHHCKDGRNTRSTHFHLQRQRRKKEPTDTEGGEEAVAGTHSDSPGEKKRRSRGEGVETVVGVVEVGVLLLVSLWARWAYRSLTSLTFCLLFSSNLFFTKIFNQSTFSPQSDP